MFRSASYMIYRVLIICGLFSTLCYKLSALSTYSIIYFPTHSSTHDSHDRWILSQPMVCCWGLKSPGKAYKATTTIAFKIFNNISPSLHLKTFSISQLPSFGPWTDPILDCSSLQNVQNMPSIRHSAVCTLLFGTSPSQSSLPWGLLIEADTPCQPYLAYSTCYNPNDICLSNSLCYGTTNNRLTRGVYRHLRTLHNEPKTNCDRVVRTRHGATDPAQIYALTQRTVGTKFWFWGPL